MKQKITAIVFFSFLCCFSLCTGSFADVISNDECMGCHSDKEMVKIRGKKKIPLYVDLDAFKKSSHKGFQCIRCHTDITEVPHAADLKMPDCASCHKEEAKLFQGCVHQVTKMSPDKPSCQGCHGIHNIQTRANIPTFLCKNCHPKIYDEYKSSVHGVDTTKGKGLGGEVATCFDCHGVHNVLKKTDPRSPVYHLNLPKTCAKCHNDPKLIKKYGLHNPNVYTAYMDSIHGRAITKSGLLVSANCSSCHGDHLILKKDNPKSKIYRGNVNKMCAECHVGVLNKYAESIHGQDFAKGNKKAPNCVDCHSAHETARVTGEAWMLDVIKECGTCHEKYITTYRDSYHGKVTTLGYVRVAKCADCHGSHEIQKRSDPRSAISKQNIVKTCEACHPGANVKFTEYIAHSNYHDKAENPILYYTYKTMITLLFTVFGLFGIHALCWLPRSWIERAQNKRKKNGGYHNV
jgi:hypothetical protein